MKNIEYHCQKMISLIIGNFEKCVHHMMLIHAVRVMETTRMALEPQHPLHLPLCCLRRLVQLPSHTHITTHIHTYHQHDHEK